MKRFAFVCETISLLFWILGSTQRKKVKIRVIERERERERERETFYFKVPEKSVQKSELFLLNCSVYMTLPYFDSK